MIFRKCPKCELNYLKDGEKYCSVCSGKMKPTSYSDDDELDICPNCGEREIVRGEEYCAECLAEFSKGLIETDVKSSVSEGSSQATVLKDIAGVGMEEIDEPTFELPSIDEGMDAEELAGIKEEASEDSDDLYDDEDDLDDPDEEDDL